MKKLFLYIVLVVLIALVVILSVLKFSGIGEKMISDTGSGDENVNGDNNENISSGSGSDLGLDDNNIEDSNLDDIDESILASLSSSARGSANWYDEAVVADSLVDNNRRLSGITVGNNWVCIGSLVNTDSSTDNPNYGGKTLGEMMGLSLDDINLSTTNVYDGTESSITSSTCSSIRNTDNGTEVLLVAMKGGTFDISDMSVTYAFSSASSGVAR